MQAGDALMLELRRELNLFLRFENLAATIFARLEVDMMRAAQLTRLFVFDIGRRDKCVC